MLANPTELLGFMGLNVLIGFAVCAGGVAKSLEKVTKVMMLGLLFLIVILAGNSLLLPGAEEGLRFYLLPDWDRAAAAGLGNVASAAMFQAFFTLSVGQGSMEIFASYMSKDNSLTGEAVRITILDTFVAIMAGLIIFPACFAFGVAPAEGPSLIFVALPNIFINMPMGQLWGGLFFLFMTFASFSTVTAVFESLIGNCMDNFGWSRKKVSSSCSRSFSSAPSPASWASMSGRTSTSWAHAASSIRKTSSSRALSFPAALSSSSSSAPPAMAGASTSTWRRSIWEPA